MKRIFLLLAVLCGTFSSAIHAQFLVATNANIHDHAGANVAGDGTNYLVGFLRSTAAATTEVSARLFGPNGAAITDEILLGLGGPVVIAYDGTNYLAAWGSGSEVKAQFLNRSGGKVGAALTFASVITSTGNSNVRELKFDGANYVLLVRSPANGIFGMQISRAGVLLNTFSAGTGEGGTVAFGSPNYLVLWSSLENTSLRGQFKRFPNVSIGGQLSVDAGPNAAGTRVAFDGRNFLALFSAGPEDNDMVANMYARLIAPNGVMGASRITVSSGAGGQINGGVASDGRNFLAVWIDGVGNTNVTLKGRFITAAGATSGNEFVILTTQNGKTPRIAQVIYDGKSFVVLGEVARLANAREFAFDGPSDLYAKIVTPLTPETVMPTLRITAPLVNFHSLTSRVTVAGTAADNVLIARIEYYVANSAGDGPAALATGTTNWTATATLRPGTNTIYVRARDASGNYSAISSVLVYYDVTTKLIVQTIGAGTVKPNLNNSNLIVGKQYSMTATPAVGSIFANWMVNGTPRTTPALSFQMQSNLVVVATFADAKAPELTVTSPANNARVTSPDLLARGTAKDNIAVTAVKYQLNDGPPTTALGTTNWQAPLTLTPGANTIRVYAEDGLYKSKTNTLTVTYVVSAPILVSTNGPGGIAPNLNGQMLEVGKVYTLTATAKPGAKFSNWSGASNTTSPRLVFQMRPDFAATANFKDATAPTVKIVSPAPNAKLVTNNIVASGTATDNGVVDSVFYRVDSGEWTLTTGTTSWTAPINGLTPGNHTLHVYALDQDGNPSKTNAVTFSLPSYQGIYLGTYTQTLGRSDNGLLAILIKADHTAIFMGGGLRFTNDSSFFYEIAIAPNGTFAFDGGSVTGKVTSAGINGGFYNPPSGDETASGGNFSLARKADTGPHAAHAGFYDNFGATNAEASGAIRAILAADGAAIFNVDAETAADTGNGGGNGDGANNSRGAGKFTISAANVITGTADVPPVIISGNFVPATLTVNGHYRSATEEGDFTLTRKTTTSALSLLAGFPLARSSADEEAETILRPIAGTSSQIVPPEVASIDTVAPPIAPVVAPSELFVISSGNAFAFAFSTVAGANYSIETSSDLKSWTTIHSFKAEASEYTYSEPATSPVGARYFRILAE